jgi:hypothetical protein
VTRSAARGRPARPGLRHPARRSPGQRAAAEYLRRVVAEYPTEQPPPSVDVDIEWLLQLAEFHRVGGLLGRCVKRGHADRLDRYVQLVTARAMMYRAQMGSDLQVASAALSGLPRGVLLLKGMSLAELYVARDRDFRDLDLLVDGRDLKEAVERLQEHGARLLDRNFELMYRTGSGELTLVLPSGSILDLHWQLLHTRRIRREFTVSTAALTDRAVPATIAGCAVRVLGHTDALWYAALHACMAGGERLAWYKDMQLLADCEDFSDEELVSWTGRTATGLPVAVMLDRARRLVGLPISPAVVDRLAPSRVWRSASRVLGRMYAPHLRAQKGPDRIFYRNTRGTGSAGLKELTLAARGDVLFKSRGDELHPWRFYSTENGLNPLRLDVDGGRRRDFFGDAAREAAGR